MVDISHNVTRGGKTDIAGSVLVTPSGGSTGTGIVAADLTNGFAGVTVSFAANETVKPVTFGVVDDAAVEGTETYRLTMSNAQPSGSFPNGAFVEATLADNDVANSNLFGPATTADTGASRIDGGINGYKMTGTVKNTGYMIHVMGFTDNGATGVGGYVFRGGPANGALSPTSVTGYRRDADGTLNLDGDAIALSTPDTTNGQPFECSVSKTGVVKLTIGGQVIFNRAVYGAQTDLSLFRFLRFQTNGAASPDVTITALSA